MAVHLTSLASGPQVVPKRAPCPHFPRHPLQSLRGHGKDIHDVAVHPSRPQLVLTASKDESIRLWNLQSSCCVAVFQGEGAHTHEVISLVRDWCAGDWWIGLGCNVAGTSGGGGGEKAG